MRIKMTILIIAVLMIVGVIIGRNSLPHEVFRVNYHPGAMYYGYIFSLIEDANVSLEGNENIRSIFPPLNIYYANTLEDIKKSVRPELIRNIEPNYIGGGFSRDISYVSYGHRFGILRGRSGGSSNFESGRSVTQAEFITMLGRLHEHGNEIIEMSNHNTDYERYLNWAVEMGIIGDRRIALMPDTILTREQAVVIVHRYIETFELNEYFISTSLFRRASLVNFKDHSEISIWALRPVEMLRRYYLIRRDFEYFRPQDDISHLAALEMLVRVGFRAYGLTAN